MISLDGLRVPGFDTKIKVIMPLPNEDLSGLGSFTLDSEQGVKPAKINVRTHIRFIDKDDLAGLVEKAKEMDGNGARHVYTVNSDVTSAYNIRKAKFDSEVSAVEHDTDHYWIVTFKLREKLSTAERVQQEVDSAAAANSQTQTTSGHENIENAFAAVEGA